MKEAEDFKCVFIVYCVLESKFKLKISSKEDQITSAQRE